MLKKISAFIMSALLFLFSGLHVLFSDLHGKDVLLAYRKAECANNEWLNVQKQYQHRSNLIPSMERTFNDYVKQEQGTLEILETARVRATHAMVAPAKLTPEKQQQFQRAQTELSSALSRLMAVAVTYPDLMADNNFWNLQLQLKCTEDSISESINSYNYSLSLYNRSIQDIPIRFFAGLLGFHNRPRLDRDSVGANLFKDNVVTYPSNY
jgi:LemA protein